MFYLKDVAIFGGLLLVLGVVSLDVWSARDCGDGVLKTLCNASAFLGFLALCLAIALFFNESYLGYLAFFAANGAFLTQRLINKGKSEPKPIHPFLILFAKMRALRDVNLALVVYLAFVFALTFLLTLAPPSGGDYDSLVYHLAAPAQYLRHHGVVELPYDHHSYFPFTMEMLYWLGLMNSGPVLAKLFHWLMLPLCCLTLFSMGRRHASTRAGLFASAIFASFPLVLWLASTAYIELGFTLFVLLAFACFLNWRNGIGGARRGVWLLWSGAFCGFALGTKYLGALTLFWLGVAALFFLLKERREYSQSALRVLAAKHDEETKAKNVSHAEMTKKNAARDDWKNLAGFALLAILLGGFWYVRNFFWTGNPVFPFAYSVFGGRGWTAQMAADYDKSQAIYGFGKSALDLLLLPFRLAMSPLNVAFFKDIGLLGMPSWPLGYEAVGGGKTGSFDVTPMLSQSFVGPLLLALGAPALLLKNKPRAIRFLGWSFLYFFAFWAFTSQQLRYLLPALALLCVPCGWAAANFSARGATLKYATLFALAAWLLFAPFYVWQKGASTRAVIFGAETPDAYLNRTFAAYPAMQWASENTPNNARFAVYGESRCFYLKRDYFFADDANNNLIDYAKVKSAADLISALRAHGATHVLWNSVPGENGGFGAPPPFMQQAIDEGKLREIFAARGYRVFEIAR